MGFSVVATSVILFGALLFFGGLMAGAVLQAQRENLDANDEREAREELRRGTDITVANQNWQNAGGGRFHVYLLNTGTTVLDATATQVLIDGILSNHKVAIRQVDGDPNTRYWAPQEELYLRIDTSPKPARVHVVTESGIGVTLTP